MKKIFYVLIGLCALVLVGCGNSENKVDGKYYSISAGKPELVLEIEGDGGTYYSDESEFPLLELDKKQGTFKLSIWLGELLYTYELHEDGTLDVKIPAFGESQDETLYKLDSKAYKQKMEQSSED
ncbi:hypothetical protein ACJBY2_03280 [Streptococcus suis]|uniref:hypothetical protein n=1 Tax=Streptococcus suis TaxID=1307 RepID=UPI00201A85D9|nr:hypothetical protein [Streptococcus suis]MCL4881181.1 hypothetical protein [Streptococcus suis]